MLRSNVPFRWSAGGEDEERRDPKLYTPMARWMFKKYLPKPYELGPNTQAVWATKPAEQNVMVLKKFWAQTGALWTWMRRCALCGWRTGSVSESMQPVCALLSGIACDFMYKAQIISIIIQGIHWYVLEWNLEIDCKANTTIFS